jgi:LPXTG-motif cell wall-anchored protein
MKSSNKIVGLVGLALVIAFGAMAGRTVSAAGPAPLNLGTAANFSILAGTPSITNTGPTTTDRSVGIDPAASVIGFGGAPDGTVGPGATIEAANAVSLQAKADLDAAYLVAASAPVTATYFALGGRTLVGGVYNSGGATLDLTGTLTLDGQFDPSSVWIFQATSDLVTASSSAVSFVNGASPCNVFWQVTSSATLGSGSTFVGTILALSSITVNNGVTVYGRALARGGTVTLINDRFLTLACAGGATALPVGPIPPTMPPFTIAPSATPAIAPTATPIRTAAATVAPVAAPTAAASVVPVGTAPVAAVAAVQVLPATSTEPLSPLLILGFALMGIGILVLRRRLRNT